MRTGLQVSTDGGLVLIAETFIDVLVHERRLADAVEIPHLEEQNTSRG